MDIGLIIGVVVVIVIVAAIAGFVLMRAPAQRSSTLKAQFGPEYDRAVSAHGGDRREAEKELAKRKDDHRRLELRDLTEDARRDYTRQWTDVQERFVDSPSDAVGDADRLVTRLMAERGYPTEGFEEQAALLSVEHARTLDDYRIAHDIAVNDAAGHATTEDLRAAMVHYRTLVSELLGHDVAGRDRAAAAHGSESAPAPGRPADRSGAAERPGPAADGSAPAAGAGGLPPDRSADPAAPPLPGGPAPGEEGGPR